MVSIFKQKYFDRYDSRRSYIKIYEEAPFISETVKKRQEKTIKMKYKSPRKARKIRTLKRDKLPYGRYQYKIDLFQSKSWLRHLHKYKNSEWFSEVEEFLSDSITNPYKIQYYKSKRMDHNLEIPLSIFLSNEDDLLKLKLSYPEIMYRIYKIEVVN